MAAGQQGSGRDSPLDRFATCAGRLSAVMEHQWLTDPPSSDRTRDLRARMLDLVAAVEVPDTAPLALARRVEAKAAHAALLRLATFAGNRAAGDQAARLERDCMALLGLSWQKGGGCPPPRTRPDTRKLGRSRPVGNSAAGDLGGT
ncbi:hypothetical protein [Gemmobacter sp.]|uniref:hypothetical protein n=1 Tax=Gemmobacter sp. TaxID=1898957 RepID=UPI002AFE4630|nr:hypothetical protein [Gemmobacter sp.]